MENSKEGRRDGRTSLPRSPTSHLHSRFELLQAAAMVVMVILRELVDMTNGQMASFFRVMLNTKSDSNMWKNLFQALSTFNDMAHDDELLSNVYTEKQMETIIASAQRALQLDGDTDNEFVDEIVRGGLAGKHIFFEYAYKSS